MEIATPPKIKIKFLTKAPANYDWTSWLDRFPGRNPVWGRCEFLFEPERQDYDWLVVYDDLPSRQGERFTLWEEKLACPRLNTLLLTTEPSSIKVYGSGFLDQFGVVLTSQEPWVIRHPGAVYRQTGLIWFYGGGTHRASYDHIANNVPANKTAIISTVCSAKRQKHTLHSRRYDFTQRLKAVIPELEIFGHGVRPLADKADALDPYRYHLAIENHVCTHHWTEKLSDCFLGLCVPFYYGCPNVTDYFPEESIVPIDIVQFEAAAERIKQAIRDQEFDKRLPAVREARRLILEKYHLFANLAAVIEERTLLQHNAEPEGGVILSRHAWRRRHVLSAFSYGLEKLSVALRHKLTFPVQPGTRLRESPGS